MLNNPIDYPVLKLMSGHYQWIVINICVDKAIKKDIKDRYEKERADKFSKRVPKSIAELMKFPELGISLRGKYDLDCDYYILFDDW